ncbi:allatotropin-like [Limulus polyphemus]|uniref:Allatotropin-like n=1 Tax=Limulus polyphemus TaxID=6850 RepID=A0ABM1TDT1_LIMPO|nr:allatotropin-like [Limulus polyphemus]XP_022254038.1 allatotropin-like [Limulus polyphemus]
MLTRKLYMIIVACLLMITTDCLPTDPFSRQERGFRNTALSTARGFGKRTFEEFANEGGDSRSIPLEWFVDQLSRNPTLAKLVAEKTVDLNGNGFISQDELYQVL